jgi:hypothetical protein
MKINSEERKAKKPDLEALTLLPASHSSNQMLLAIGSGSKPNRCRGALVPIDSSGNISGLIEPIDLSNLYSYLQDQIGTLNIEGATFNNKDLVFFQRGNTKNNINASIRLSLDDFYCLLKNPYRQGIPKIQITHYDLGHIEKIPYCFTDASSLSNGDIIFTASAEDTDNAYLDGKCLGSVIGIISTQNEITFLEPIDRKIKLEGIAAEIIGNQIKVILVSDADNPNIPASLYSASIEIYKSTQP